MKSEVPADQLQICDFNPIAIHFLGLGGCREMLHKLLDPSIDKLPAGLDFWLQKTEIRK